MAKPADKSPKNVVIELKLFNQILPIKNIMMKYKYNYTLFAQDAEKKTKIAASKWNGVAKK